MKQRLLLTAVITTIVLIIAIPLIHKDKEQKISPSTQATVWEKISTWSQADPQFSTHPGMPLLLYKDEIMNKAIYIQDGTVRSISLDNDQGDKTTLLEVEASEGYYWRSGNTLLLAFSIHQSNPDNYKNGEWYAIDIGDTKAIPPSILELKDAFLDPAKLLTVTIVEDAGLFLLVEEIDNIRFNEYFYAAGESRLMYVNLEVPRNADNFYEEHYLGKRPQATVDVQYFQKKTPYPLEDGSSIYAYEDDRGTILVYSGTDDYRFATRYAGVKLINVALKTDVLGNNYPLIWTDGAIGNTASMSYPTMGNIELNGIKSYLSVFDLLNGRGLLNELWVRDLPLTLTSSAGERAKEEWELLNETALPAEITEQLWIGEEIRQEVSDAANRSDPECIFGCGGDFYNIPEIRSIEGIWHVLIGVSMYQLKEDKFSLLGQFPVSVASTHGEGSDGYTALDYTKIGTDWYVADTYGNRIIKLDDKLKVIAEYSLPTPSHITLTGNGKLHVNSLRGITILDTNLNWIGEAEKNRVKVQSLEPSEHLFSKVSHYTDKKLGTYWIYTGEGKLVIYHPREQEYTTTFIGNPQSGRAIVRIIPYQDEILVLSDYRLLRFHPDGRWKRTIDFTRGPSDGSYNKTPVGENSHVVDATNHHIYIVQGARIVAIDLANNFAYPLFQQDYSEIGDLILYNNRLVFTIEGNPYYSNEESTERSNELIILHPRIGIVNRYVLDSGWYSEGLDKQQLQLWSYKDPHGSWEEIIRGSISLDRLIPFNDFMKVS